MITYEYQCAGHGRFDCRRPMDDRAMPAPCPVCGEPSPFVPSCPVILTDTNNPLKSVGNLVGMPTETRADVRSMEARGIGMVSQREVDDCQRRARVHLAGTEKRIETIIQDTLNPRIEV